MDQTGPPLAEIVRRTSTRYGASMTGMYSEPREGFIELSSPLIRVVVFVVGCDRKCHALFDACHRVAVLPRECDHPQGTSHI